MSSICVDIDNVVARTDDVMREVIRECSQDRVDLVCEDVVCFDYWMCRDGLGRRFDRTEWTKIHTEFTHNHLLRVRPFEGVSQYLARISDRFDIHLATSRLPEGWGQTERWVKQHAIPHRKIHYVKHGEKHLIGQEFTAAIEDDREQAYAFQLSGVRTFLLAHPWNHIGPHSPLRRVAAWEDLTAEILNLP